MEGRKGLAEGERYANIGLSKEEKAKAKGGKSAKSGDGVDQSAKIKLIASVVMLVAGVGLITWFMLNQFGVIGNQIEEPGIPAETPPPLESIQPAPVRPGTPASTPMGAS